VLRSCEAFGIQDVHVVENPDVPFAPHDKVTQGCDKWLDVHRHRTFAACARALRATGHRICVSAVRDDARSVFEMEFDRPLALVFGNERTGVTPDALAAADEAFWIPMRGFTRSLNVSAAVSATLSRAIGWRLDHDQPGGDLPETDARALRDRFYALSVKQRKRLFGR
jgi:tRNA (guanosine-2'-O-)-methyltransferase